MESLFGEVAQLYDDIRPGYPAAAGQALLAYAGNISQAVEIGAGTGKATALLAGRGFPVTCIEPDARMAGLLTARFSTVTVDATDFEQWTPPPDGVSLIVAALAWHWLDPARRADLVAAALAPGGTVAILDRRSHHLDPDLATAIDAVFGDGIGPRRGGGDDLRRHPAFGDHATAVAAEERTLTTGQFLELQQTYGPFRRASAPRQQALLDGLRAAVDAHGGLVRLRHETTVIMSRR